MPDDPEVEKALQTAYRLLAARARSEREVRAKLGGKGINGRIIDQVIDRLHELNYLNDASFARQWAGRLAEDRLAGNRRIEMSLREKGIEPALIDGIIAEVRQTLPEREAIRRAIRKKLKDGASPLRDDREKRRLAQHLLGRGFAPGLIYEMIREAEEEYRNDDRQSD